MSKKKKVSSDVKGITRLITETTIGVTDLVETMHRRVVHPPFLPSTPIQHLITRIAGFTYDNIRWSTRLIGSGLEKALDQLTPLLGEGKTSDEKEALRSTLNGLVGDYLVEKENPLKITMQFRRRGKVFAIDPISIAATYPNVNGKLLLMVHGSCMNDLQWSRKEHNHGTALEEDFQKTPLYLHYNSGLHVSTNGQDLNAQLEKLVSNWPVPLEELTIIGHSMGGLVARSALYYGQQKQSLWTRQLKKIIFLGTPHHGTPLERAGNYLDVILEAIPYAKPFARLGKIRSAGVTDLRYGNLIDEDWQSKDRFEMTTDQREALPLPKEVACYAIAAVMAKKTDSALKRGLGDRLVGLKSALGQHRKSGKSLNFKKENTWISYENSHLDLLSDPGVYAKIKSWML